MGRGDIMWAAEVGRGEYYLGGSQEGVGVVLPPTHYPKGFGDNCTALPTNNPSHSAGTNIQLTGQTQAKGEGVLAQLKTSVKFFVSLSMAFHRFTFPGDMQRQRTAAHPATNRPNPTPQKRPGVAWAPFRGR